MIIAFDEVWNFIQTTNVPEKAFTFDSEVVELIHPNSGKHIPSNVYTIKNRWEKRFNIDLLRTMWDECYTFIVHGSCVTPNVRQLIEEVECDHNVDAQAHIYMGKLGSRSFPIHSDNPDNLIVQCIGKSKATVYNEYANQAGVDSNISVTIKEQHILEPGDSIYIPSLQYHLFEPLTDRLSISIPMYKR